jgi:hypothetical protein
MSDRRLHILKRIMSKVLVSTTAFYHHTPCWLWTGPTSGKPDPENRNSRGHSYPRLTINGFTCAVHRVIYTHFFGFIPGDMTVDHECKNRLCINPCHLSLVSHYENQRRRDGKTPRKGTEYAICPSPEMMAEALRFTVGVPLPAPVPVFAQHPQVLGAVCTPCT